MSSGSSFGAVLIHQGKLTVSAGDALVPDKYPISVMAEISKTRQKSLPRQKRLHSSIIFTFGWDELLLGDRGSTGTSPTIFGSGNRKNAAWPSSTSLLELLAERDDRIRPDGCTSSTHA